MALEKPRPAPGLSAVLVTVLAFLLLYVPLVVMVVQSFIAPSNGPGSPGVFSLVWYEKAFANEAVLDSLKMSLWVGFWSTLIATFVGTTAALALERTKFPGRKLLDTLTHVPLIMPEIVLGLSMLVWFVLLKITLGSFSVILAHVTFSVSYVIITVRARLSDFDLSLEEAARDLGAGPWQVFSRVTLPLILPAVLSGALMAFTLSFDDFLITFFTAGVGSDTLPLKIYAMVKFGVTREINALSTVMLVATFALVSLFFRPSRGKAGA